MANVKGILVEIGGDTSGLQKALKDVNSSSSSLSKELKGINSLLKLDPKNTELVVQKQKVLKEEISKTEEKLKLLKDAQKQADEAMKNGGEVSQENYRKLQREIIETESKLKSFKLEASNWTKAGRTVEEFGKKVTNISEKLDKIGTTFTTKLTLPVTAIATGMLKITSDFDTSMKQVAATMGITKDEIESGSHSYQILEKAALKCGETTKYSAGEAAGALNYLALAGYDAEKSAEVLPKVLNLAAAGGLELATASDMVTDAMSALGLETKDIDKYIDEMAKTSQKSNTSVAQLGEATLTCAGTAKLANMSLETMNAELGILANNGIKGAEGGTHLRNIILSLTSPTDTAAKALKNLGINVTDSSGNIRDLNDIMADFNKKMDKMSDNERTNVISKIFNKTDISAVNALIKGSGDEFEKLKGEISKCDNAAQAMADTMNSSLEGEMTLVKSQIEGISIKFGTKMMPTLKKAVKWVSDLADKFSKLSDEQVETIIKTAAIVAAIGPAIKIFSTFGKGIGAVTNGIGLFSQAIGVMNGKTVSSSKSVNNLAGVLTKLISPAGLATTAILAVAGAIIYLSTKESEETKAAKKFAEEMSNTRKELEEYNKGIDDVANSELSRINYVEKLKNELKTLADENGKVQEKDKGRVSFILNELNEALGTEYKLNGDIIQSYKDLQKEIDSTIEKKKAEIKLNAKKEKYENAIRNQDTELENLRKANEEVQKTGMSYDELQKKVDHYWTKINEYSANPTKYYTPDQNGRLVLDSEIKDLIEHEDYYNQLTAVKNARDDSLKMVKEYTKEVKDYEKDYAEFVAGNYEKIGNIITVTTEDWAKKSIDEIKTSISTQSKYLTDYKDIYNEVGNDVAYQNVKQAEQNMRDIAKNLADRTQTLESLGPAEIEAWKELAYNCYDAYQEQLSSMDETVRTRIEEATGVIYEETPDASKAAQFMSDNIISKLDNDEAFRNEALSAMYSYLNGLNDYELRALLESAGVKDVEKVMEGIRNGNLAEEEGKNMLISLNNGLSSKSFQGSLFQTASSIAQGIASRLSVKFNINGVSEAFKTVINKNIPGHKSGLDYVPRDDYIARLHRGERVLTAEENKAYMTAKEIEQKIQSEINKFNIQQIKDFGKLQSELSKRVSNCVNSYTFNMNFYPQEMSDAELNNVYNFMNKKLGLRGG